MAIQTPAPFPADVWKFGILSKLSFTNVLMVRSVCKFFEKVTRENDFLSHYVFERPRLMLAELKGANYGRIIDIWGRNFGHSVKELNVSQLRFAQADLLEMLKLTPNLEKLMFSGKNRLSPAAILEGISLLTRLNELEFYCCYLNGGECVKTYSGVTRLKFAYSSGEEGMEILANALPSLTSLSVYKCAYGIDTDGLIAQRNNLKHLTYYSMGAETKTTLWERSRETFSKLESLELKPPTYRQIAEAYTFSGLKKLVTPEHYVFHTPEQDKAFSNFSKIKSWHFVRCSLSKTDFPPFITSLKNLEELSITDCSDIEWKDYGFLKKMTQLKTLRLCSIQLSTELFLKILKAMPALQHLSIRRCNYFNNEVFEYAAQKPLLSLDVRGCPLDYNIPLEVLQGMQSLTALSITPFLLEDKLCSWVSSLKNLRYFHFDCIFPAQEESLMFFDPFLNATQLKFLRLSKCYIENDNEIVLRIARELPSLETLMIDYDEKSYQILESHGLAVVGNLYPVRGSWAI